MRFSKLVFFTHPLETKTRRIGTFTSVYWPSRCSGLLQDNEVVTRTQTRSTCQLLNSSTPQVPKPHRRAAHNGNCKTAEMGLGPAPDQDDGALQLSTINTGHPQGVAVRRLRAMSKIRVPEVQVDGIPNRPRGTHKTPRSKAPFKRANRQRTIQCMVESIITEFLYGRTIAVCAVLSAGGSSSRESNTQLGIWISHEQPNLCTDDGIPIPQQRRTF